jgi:hypothetical protein
VEFFDVLGPLFLLLSAEFGWLGKSLFYVAFFIVPAVSVIIETMEGLVALTPTKADDRVLAKVKKFWKKAKPILEVLPHSRFRLWKIVKLFSKGVFKLWLRLSR